MKKILFGLVVVFILSSCSHTYVTFNDLKPEDYGNYIYTHNYNSTYSPTEYNVIKGYNPANDYSWQCVSISTWTKKPFNYYYYKGDYSTLVKAYFPNADIIMIYSGNYYIGYKKEK